MRSAVLLVALLFGCGDDGATTVDVDAPPPLPACTGAVYDSCADTTSSSDCMGGTCRLFMQDGITICTTSCDASNPCPNDKNGNPVTCNGMGRCKASPNDCTL